MRYVNFTRHWLFCQYWLVLVSCPDSLSARLVSSVVCFLPFMVKYSFILNGYTTHRYSLLTRVSFENPMPPQYCRHESDVSRASRPAFSLHIDASLVASSPRINFPEKYDIFGNYIVQSWLKKVYPFTFITNCYNAVSLHTEGLYETKTPVKSSQGISPWYLKSAAILNISQL